MITPSLRWPFVTVSVRITTSEDFCPSYRLVSVTRITFQTIGFSFIPTYPGRSYVVGLVPRQCRHRSIHTSPPPFAILLSLSMLCPASTPSKLAALSSIVQ